MYYYIFRSLIELFLMRYDDRKSFMKMQSVGSFDEIFIIYVVATWREEKRQTTLTICLITSMVNICVISRLCKVNYDQR